MSIDPDRAEPLRFYGNATPVSPLNGTAFPWPSGSQATVASLSTSEGVETVRGVVDGLAWTTAIPLRSKEVDQEHDTDTWVRSFVQLFRYTDDVDDGCQFVGADIYHVLCVHVCFGCKQVYAYYRK
jgi:hypothetical protein